MATGVRRIGFSWRESASLWHTTGSPLAYHPMPETSCKLDSAPKASAVKAGRWDPLTGTVVFDDGSTAQSSVTGPPITANARRAAKKSTPPSNPPERQRLVRAPQEKPKRQPQPKPIPIKQDPGQDPRVQEVIRMYQAGEGVRAICKALRMSPHTATLILRHHRAGRTKSEAKMFRNGSAKITPAQVREIRQSPEPNKALAERYGLSTSAIRRIKRRAQWAHIPDEPDDAAAD